MIYDAASGLWFRPDTNDQYVIDTEVRGYVRRLDVGPGAHVLDVGAHIGAATRNFVYAGADLVVAIEPDPENFALLERNLPLGHVALWAAAVGDERPTVTLWRNTRRGRNSHSLRPRRGRSPVDVPALNIRTLCESYTITHVKMDAEGTEYELVDDFPTSVSRLIVEFHAGDAEWQAKVPGAIAALKAQGFAPDRQPESTAWNWVVGWQR